MLLSHWVLGLMMESFFFFSSRRRHTRCSRDWSSDVCSSDLHQHLPTIRLQKPDHVLEQHTLAAAALADHRGDLPPGNLQVDSLQDRLSPERLFHPHEANHRLRFLLTFHHSTCDDLTLRPRSQNSPR